MNGNKKNQETMKVVPKPVPMKRDHAQELERVMKECNKGSKG